MERQSQGWGCRQSTVPGAPHILQPEEGTGSWRWEQRRGGARNRAGGGRWEQRREGGSLPGFLWMGGCGAFISCTFQRSKKQSQLLRVEKHWKNWSLGTHGISECLFKELFLCISNLRAVSFSFCLLLFFKITNLAYSALNSEMFFLITHTHKSD